MSDDRWRKVSEEMPERGYKVLVCHRFGLPFCARYSLDRNEWVDELNLLRHPTHWRPLPAPPETEED